jgi:glutamate racemase
MIERVVPPGMKVIDSAEAAADAAVRMVNGKVQAATPSSGVGRASPTAQVRCFATDSVEKFERLGSRFLGQPVGHVELVDLGG